MNSCKAAKSAGARARTRKKQRGPRRKRLLLEALNSVSFSGFGETQNLTEARERGGPCTLTTAQQEDLNGKASCEKRAEPGTERERERTAKQETIGLRTKRRKNQANKSAGWMPRHHTPKKDVASCEKPRGAASRQRTVDIRMGEPGGSNVPSP